MWAGCHPAQRLMTMVMRWRLSAKTANPTQVWAPPSRRSRVRRTGTQRRSAVGTPAGVPAAGALLGDVQLAGDLGLRAALGEQLGGTLPASLARRPILRPSLSCCLLAAGGGHAGMLPHQRFGPLVKY